VRLLRRFDEYEMEVMVEPLLAVTVLKVKGKINVD
jgi:hypothetical protein